MVYGESAGSVTRLTVRVCGRKRRRCGVLSLSSGHGNQRNPRNRHRGEPGGDPRRHRRSGVGHRVVAAASERRSSREGQERAASQSEDEGEGRGHHRRTSGGLHLDQEQGQLDAGQLRPAAFAGCVLHADARRRQDEGRLRNQRRPGGAAARLRPQARRQRNDRHRHQRSARPGAGPEEKEVIVVAGRGPLDGVRVIELGGIGPGPHAAMVLADLGADVVRVRRPGGLTMPAEHLDLLHRGKRIVDLDVKTDPQALLELAARAYVLLDCFRPGTCERLGIGPDDCAAVNPRLIFARITGWGQHGPLAATAGHDINYLSQTGALSALGYADRPPLPPLNLVADFGGGSMLVLLGIVVALYERERSGRGQIVDAAMVDGVSVLAQMMWTMKGIGSLRDQRESFLLDGGAPFYRCYEASDGKYLAVGAIEPQFFAALLAGLGLPADEVPNQLDIGSFPQMHAQFAERFASRTRDDWTQVFAGTDACVTPVLTWGEAATNDHLRARSTVITAHGVEQAAPAPRFSRTPAPPVERPPAATTPLSEINW